MADLLYSAAIEAGMDKDRISVIPGRSGIEKAIMDAAPGEMIVIFYEELDPVVKS